MKVWLLGGTGSSGSARSRGSSIGGRLDRFVTEIAQAVEDRAPVNYAVDRNYQLISDGAGAYTPSGRDHAGGLLSSARRRLRRDPRSRG